MGVACQQEGKKITRVLNWPVELYPSCKFDLISKITTESVLGIKSKSKSFLLDNAFSARKFNTMNDSRYIFIMGGRHRSGTTFLYETLSNILPVSYVSIYHTLNADKIKENNRNGTEQDIKKDINEYFRVNSVTTWLKDNIALSADTRLKSTAGDKGG